MKGSLNYNDFVCLVQKQMQERLGDTMEVKLHQVMKNNSICLDALSISEKGSKIAPTVYLNDFYEAHREGESIPDLVTRLAAIYETCRPRIQFDPSFYADYERVKDRLVFRLISREKNRELLEQVPYRPFLDLAAVVYYSFESENMGLGCITVYESHRKKWDISEEELFETARENTMRLQPEELLSMDMILQKVRESRPEIHVPPAREDAVPGEQPMYVLTNKNNYYGAAVLLYDSVLQNVAEKLKGDFWVLPSSVHECIVVPAGFTGKREELQKMVREVNRTEVAPEDFLSDEVYFYQSEIHRLSR